MKWKKLLKIIFTLGLNLIYNFLKEYFKMENQIGRINAKSEKKINKAKRKIKKRNRVDESHG